MTDRPNGNDEAHITSLARMLRPLDEEALEFLEMTLRWTDMAMASNAPGLIVAVLHADINPLRAAVEQLCAEAGVPLGCSIALGGEGVIASSWGNCEGDC